MTRKLIIFLLCRKLGVKRFQPFRFTNQKSKTDYYMFDRYGLLKYVSDGDYFRQSSVRLNWLLDDNCEVVAVKEEQCDEHTYGRYN